MRRICHSIILLLVTGGLVGWTALRDGRLARPAQRCDFHLPKVSGGTTVAVYKLDTLDGKTFSVPATVTRIARDAFTFEDQRTQTAVNTDIVYMMDNSESMVQYAKAFTAVVTEDMSDTLFGLSRGAISQWGFIQIGQMQHRYADTVATYDVFCCTNKYSHPSNM